MKRIAIFASGSGSNAENIARYFAHHPQVEISLILSNNPNAYVLQRAIELNIPTKVFSRDDFYKNFCVEEILREYKIDLVVLAGFLWLIPLSMIRNYPSAIINIHPALLPKYGGKGMYGMKVHQSVVAEGDHESGITIHYVNEKYDEGATIFQARCVIEKEDSPERVAEKVHNLEYEHFPRVIEKILFPI